jgi:hydroxyacylglutathione hydrolase
MPRIPLEDNFFDVISKAQRGHRLTDKELAAKARITQGELASLKKGEFTELPLRAVARALGLGGDALMTLALRKWYPEQPLFPRGFAMFNTPHEDMTVNSYLVWDTDTKHAAAFDTGSSVESMLDIIKTGNLNLRYIFITHTHDDHIADLARLAAATPAEVWSSELEPVAHPGAKFFKENAHFHLGEIAVKTLLTSGHSVGQTSFYVTGLSWPLAIVGDSLFAGSMGGGLVSYEEQYRNNRRKLLNLPGDTVFACGHGPLTTLRQEKQNNPFFTR